MRAAIFTSSLSRWRNDRGAYLSTQSWHEPGFMSSSMPSAFSASSAAASALLLSRLAFSSSTSCASLLPLQLWPDVRPPIDAKSCIAIITVTIIFNNTTTAFRHRDHHDQCWVSASASSMRLSVPRLVESSEEKVGRILICRGCPG